MVSFEDDVYRRARACRDKGMGSPLPWDYIANHLWQYFLEYPEQWPSAKGEIQDKEVFYGWVKKSVERYDREMKGE